MPETVQIPINFLQAIRQKDSKTQVLWMRWLVYADGLRDSTILAKLQAENPSLDSAEVRDIYEWGVKILFNDSLLSVPKQQPQNSYMADQNELNKRIEHIEDQLKQALDALQQKERDMKAYVLRVIRGFNMEKRAVKNEIYQFVDRMVNNAKSEVKLEVKSEVKQEVTKEVTKEVQGQIVTHDKPTPRKSGRSKNFTTDEFLFCKQVLDYLNEKAGTGYSTASKGNCQIIIRRKDEGYELEQFYKVIDNKVAEWLNSDMEAYLRPVTLFSEKFDNYLNQLVFKRQTKEQQSIQNIQDANSEAKQYFTVGGNAGGTGSGTGN